MEDIFDQLLDENKDEENEAVEVNENRETDDGKRMVKFKKKTLNKRSTLDVTRLTGSRGIGIIENESKNITFKGKGHEEEDLGKIIAFLYYWTHRLYPKLTFKDCLEKIEQLGSKKPTQTYLKKLRLGMLEDNTADEITEEVINVSEKPALTDEQKEMILKNRMLAQAMRVKKLQSLKKTTTTTGNNDEPEMIFLENNRDT